MPTSGCSCRYRSSLRTCSGGPGRTSCTGQYRYPVSGQRNGFPGITATRHGRGGYERLPPPRTCRCARQTPVPTFASEAAARQHPVHHRTAGYRRALVRLFRAQIRRRPAHPHAEMRALHHRMVMRCPVYRERSWPSTIQPFNSNRGRAERRIRATCRGRVRRSGVHAEQPVLCAW